MKIGVVGSGIMGNGIAQTFSMAGYDVILSDLNEEALVSAREVIAMNIERVLKKQESTQGGHEILQRIQFTTSKGELADADLIVEAIVENMEMKKAIFKELDEICEQKTIFASNTSSYSITEIGAATKRPDRVCGMHFFNPVPVMKLIEVIRGEATSDETVACIQQLVTHMGKESITVADAPLFVVNRILIPMISEAIFVLDEGIATAEDIDKGMVLGTNQPIGPLKLADMIGLDTLLYVQETLLNETGDSKYRIPQSLKKLVRAGHYGRKTGQGFYRYT
ncbi:3-hydroxyacyl-CoA dehydrogenase NAD-binding domain-containing protein [Solibacillus sp. MA9]|uniref:3-hydroxyacyl-CoA dehydrogenase NAD-binding domain-containing protein n=1 Tax=Solibacillus palustris TaxID=2908203 RepID=A0ABS9U8D5_9BACL|nr:3-hydroxyacyl-CoA dehydrogenase NAD-binding domain-containing protein [Solibacillus sp. MA9]MCH7320602.1 3-hydroxyacyl-CoA dehydrogenase NAD-binding domain-containing protein [Solibacillus sp. MA9]